LSHHGRTQLLACLQKIRPRIKGVSTIGTPFQGNVTYAADFDQIFAGIAVHRNINNQDIVARVPLVAHPVPGDKLAAALVSPTAEISLKVLAHSVYGSILGNLEHGGLAYAPTKGLRYIVSQRMVGTTVVEPNVASDTASSNATSKNFINYDEFVPVWIQPYSLLDHNPDDYVRHLDQAAGGGATGSLIWRFFSGWNLEKLVTWFMVLGSWFLELLDPRGLFFYFWVVWMGILFELAVPWILAFNFLVSSIISVWKSVMDEIHEICSNDY